MFYELLLQLKAFVSTIKTQQLKIIDRETCKTTRAPHELSYNIETWNVMTANCLLWTLSSVMSHPRLRITCIIIVETARLCFLHASKKEMNSLNDGNDIWQVEVYARAVLFVVMTENSYLSNRYFISVLKMKTCDFKHKYQLCLNY